jgi:hypothetical protein
MSGCIDVDIGSLLHAYELKVLNEEDVERFEMHLMACEYCFNEIEIFVKESSLLNSDREIQGIVKDTARKLKRSESMLEKILEYLWPETLFIFRPAFAYLLVLILVIPAFYGIMSVGDNTIRPVQSIMLFPDRSAEEKAFQKSRLGDGLISFIFRGATAGEPYRIVIESREGQVIFRDKDFTGFDDFDTGRLILPREQMKPGSHRLIITDPRAEPPLDKQEYQFRIEE